MGLILLGLAVGAGAYIAARLLVLLIDLALRRNR
jgi:hypothetical protein